MYPSRLLGPLLIATTLVAGAPPASAHVAEEPIEVETHLLQDEGEDAFYWWEGYDLYNLFVREAYHEPADAEGLIFRFTIYGGFTPAHAAATLHIDIGFESPDGPQRVRLSTEDDRVWSGDMDIIFLEVSPDRPPFTGVTTKIQAFVPYDRVGLGPGDVLANVYMVSWADGEIVDIAPGGFYAPGPGDAEVPAPSERLVAELPLVGPVGYVHTEVAVAADTVTLTAHNALAEQEQHVGVRLVPTPGWGAEIMGAAQQGVAEGAMGAFSIRAVPDATVTAPLAIAVITDVGGREWFHVGVTQEGLVVAPASAGVPVTPPPEPEPEETPGLGAIAFLVTVGAAAVACGRFSEKR